MYRTSFCAAVALLSFGMIGAAPARAESVHPVVLELFTSNSCSSCPPAYRALDQLAKTADASHPLIRLDEHVDYWNQLDWVDRLSSPRYTARQWRYAHKVFHSGQVYTPQLVIDGRLGLIGSREAEARQDIARLADSVQPLTPVANRHGQTIHATLAEPADRPAGKLWFALTEDHVTSHVGRGENAGRTLHENGVVRAMAPATGHDASAQLDVPSDAAPGELHVVAFVQAADGHIVAAGERGLAEAVQPTS